MSTFINIPFTSAINTIATMPKFFNPPTPRILRTIITGIYNNRIVIQSRLFQIIQHAPHMVICLNHKLTIATTIALIPKFLTRAYRIVRRCKWQVQKKRLTTFGTCFFALHPLNRLIGKPRQTLIVNKIRRNLHPHCAQCFKRLFWCVLIRRHDAIIHMPVIGFLSRINCRRYSGISPFKPGENSVVERSGYAIEIIKSLIQRHIGDRLTPIAIAHLAGKIHTQVPLAYHRRIISICPKH